MLSAFSTSAGNRAAVLDQGASELARLAGGLTIETLRKQAEPTDDPNRTASP
jgi:hypothetical protein